MKKEEILVFRVAFPLGKHCLKPYSQSGLTQSELLKMLLEY